MVIATSLNPVARTGFFHISLYYRIFRYITLQSVYIVYGGSGYLSEWLNLKRLGERARGGGGSVCWRGSRTTILAKGNLRNRSTQSSVLTNYNAGKPC